MKSLCWFLIFVTQVSGYSCFKNHMEIDVIPMRIVGMSYFNPPPPPFPGTEDEVGPVEVPGKNDSVQKGGKSKSLSNPKNRESSKSHKHHHHQEQGDNPTTPQEPQLVLIRMARNSDFGTVKRGSNTSTTMIYDNIDSNYSVIKIPAKSKRDLLPNTLLLSFTKNRDKILTPNFRTHFKSAAYFHAIDDNMHSGEAYLIRDSEALTHDQIRAIIENVRNDKLVENGIERAPLTLTFDDNGAMTALFYTKDKTFHLNPKNKRSFFSGMRRKKSLPLTFGSHILKVAEESNSYVCNLLNDNGVERYTLTSQSLRDQDIKKSDPKPFPRLGKIARHIPLKSSYNIEGAFLVTEQNHTTPMEYYPLLASQLNNLYNNPTLMAKVNFQLKDILSYPVANVVTDNDGTTLSNLRTWKKANVPTIDVAVMISNAFKSPTGGILGTASVGDICVSDGSVVVAQDSGFFSVQAIGHELGHVFGLIHDQDVGCLDTAGLMYYAVTLDKMYTWSPCSSFTMGQTLRSGRANCLTKDTYKGSTSYTTEKFPGQQVDFKTQCEADWGPGYTPTLKGSSCTYMVCSDSKGTPFNHSYIALDGTYCTGSGKTSQLSDSKTDSVCYQSQCLKQADITNSKPGSWSDWTPWTDCLGFCPLGYRIRNRTCTLQNEVAGPYCDGDYTDYGTCPKDGCPETSDQVGQKTCDAQYPSSKFMMHPSYPCVIACNLNGAVYITGMDVADGTKYNGTGVCYQKIIITNQ